MKRSVIILILFFSAAGTALGIAEERSDRLIVYFFGSRTCAECLQIKEDILKPLAAEYPSIISLRLHEIEDPASFQLMVRMEKAYGVKDGSPQELYLPDDVLLGAEEIMDRGEDMIRQYLFRPETWKEPAVEINPETLDQDVRKKYQKFTFLAVVLAGLMDGVNPCAIATMIFLISFLAARKRSRREILTIGLVFTATVYITYLLLGVGAFRAIIALEEYRILSHGIRWLAIGLALGVAFFSFRDSYLYYRHRELKEMKLQLPRPLKMRIHRLISRNLRGAHFIAGAAVTGFLVSLLEAVCTGQVYLPTIVIMTRTTGLNLTGWMYLIFYNFLFILPLLVVMILAYLGLTWNKLARVTRENLAGLKAALGVVMSALAIFFFFSL